MSDLGNATTTLLHQVCLHNVIKTRVQYGCVGNHKTKRVMVIGMCTCTHNEIFGSRIVHNKILHSHYAFLQHTPKNKVWYLLSMYMYTYRYAHTHTSPFTSRPEQVTIPCLLHNCVQANTHMCMCVYMYKCVLSCVFIYGQHTVLTYDLTPSQVLQPTVYPPKPWCTL